MLFGPFAVAFTALTLASLSLNTATHWRGICLPLFIVQVAIVAGFAVLTMRLALRVRSLKAQKRLFE